MGGPGLDGPDAESTGQDAPIGVLGGLVSPAGRGESWAEMLDEIN
jgi:hypothetical protein